MAEQPKRFDPKVVGEQIRRFRRERGWTQAELAGLIEPRLSKGYLSEIEKGSGRQPSIDVLERIASAFGMQVGALLSTTELSEPLAQFLEVEAIRPADREMLSSIRFEYPPRTVRRWRFIWDALRASVALDEDTDAALFFSVIDRPGPEVRDVLLAEWPGAKSDRVFPFEVAEWVEIDEELVSTLMAWDGEIDESKVFDLAENLRSEPSAKAVLTLLLGTWVWLASHEWIIRGQVGLDALSAKKLFRGPDRGRLEMALLGAWLLLRRSGPTEAYRSVVAGGINHVPGLSTVAWSAFFFFAAYDDIEVTPQPLLLDATIGVALTDLSPRRWSHNYEFTAEEYGVYLSLVGFWTLMFPELEPKLIQRHLLMHGWRVENHIDSDNPVNEEGGEFYS